MEPGPSRDRISDLYHRALACTPEDRGAFLEEACDGDTRLREEVESLLRFESDSARFLETPAAVVAGDLARAPDRSRMIGRQLGPYTIVAPLGAGGMGEVYRARDTKLGRDVAIKILPSHFMADPERRARFAREARLLATLNHPHIGAIHGLEETDGLTALVLELVEGPTLADRLARGPLPIADVLAIARQIAEALEAAHEKGIVHRDLKPANVVLQSTVNASGVPSGDVRAKVLDFGLAKSMALGLEGDLTQRPGSLDGTEEGRILGTPAYMSPEQARGQAVDKRTDIWALGCVLFEMLSGRRAFSGDTISDTFVSILEREPDWTALPAGTPAAVRTLLDRCLRKDAGNRLHDIADARIELDDGSKPIAVTRSADDVAQGVLHRSRQRLGWIVAAALALALAGTMLLNNRRVPPTAPQLVEFQIPAPQGWSFSGASPQFAVSPDGGHVAFVATSKVGTSIWVRSLAAVEPRELSGTGGAKNPFWSPDSRSIGFFANGQLKRVLASGGSPNVLCATDTGGFRAFGTWNSDDVIVFGPFDGGHLFRINATKPGTPTPVTTQATIGTHLWPWFLADGQHFLFHAVEGETSELRVGSLTAPGSEVIGTLDSPVAYAAGYLFFVHNDNLMAQSFNEETRRPQGEPVPLGVQVGPLGFHTQFSVSATGRLVFASPSGSTSQLTWLDRTTGRPVGIVGDQGIFNNLDLSPDGQRVAVDKLTPRPGGVPAIDIWVIDLATGIATPVTDDPANDLDPAWSPDGKHIVFNSNRLGGWSLFMRPSDGSGGDMPLLKSGTESYTVAAWSGANDLVFNVFGKNNPDGDLWTLSMSGDRTPKAYVTSKHAERNGAFSLDGRWVAYQSNASGRSEIVVRPFPSKGPAQPVSRNGGAYPRWRGDGKELFFLSPEGTMMAVGFDATNGVPEGVPRALFPAHIRGDNSRPYAVARNGDRFLFPIVADAPLRVVTDWRALLNR